MKKIAAILLALLILSGTFTCFAAELNEDAVNAIAKTEAASYEAAFFVRGKV